MNGRRVPSKQSALNKKAFANRGTELYWNLRRFFEERLISFNSVKDYALIDQLKSRRHKQHSINGMLVCERKADAEARECKSPDRADALVLAFSNTTVDDFKRVKAEEVKTKLIFHNIESLQRYYEKQNEVQLNKKITYEPHHGSLLYLKEQVYG